MLFDNGRDFTVHEKQCKRLKPKRKPREFNLVLKRDGTDARVFPMLTKVEVLTDQFELVRVREIL